VQREGRHHQHAGMYCTPITLTGSFVLLFVLSTAGVEHLLRNVKDATISTLAYTEPPHISWLCCIPGCAVNCRRGAPAAQRKGRHHQHAGE
jgi:hypothetical protein